MTNFNEIKTELNLTRSKNEKMGKKLENYQQNTDPKQLITGLDDSIPILLFPVRLETRFVSIDGMHELWVRIFPDDIAIDTHEEALTADEKAAGETYWQLIWDANNDYNNELAAWRGLVKGYGSQRAAWIAKQLKPTNLNKKPENRPTFKELSIKEDSWSATPCSRVMPDCFVVSTWIGGVQTHEICGQAIPDTLVTGPDPTKGKPVFINNIRYPDNTNVVKNLNNKKLIETDRILIAEAGINLSEHVSVFIEKDELEWLIVDKGSSYRVQLENENLNFYKDNFLHIDGELTVDPQIAWLTDFYQAVGIGMAVRIPLNPGEEKSGFDRLLVLGIKHKLNKFEAQSRVEELINHHHYSNGGFSLLPQGTATNNTDKKKSALGDEKLEEETSFRIEMAAPLYENTSEYFEKSDGQRLAEALGINDECLQHINYSGKLDGIHDGGYDFKESLAMNCALWPATLGYFMEEMMRPIFNQVQIQKTRDFFTRHVSGRGALPSIRVDDQPYGILPTTAFSKWEYSDSDTDAEFKRQMQKIIKKLDSTWAEKVKSVAHVGATDDPDKDLLNMLGLHASSIEYYQRESLGENFIWNLMIFRQMQKAAEEWNNKLHNAARKIIADMGYNFAEDIPQVLKAAFCLSQWYLDGPIVDDAPLSEIRGISHICEEIKKNYIEWLAGANLDEIRDENFQDNVEPPNVLLYKLLRHATLLQYWDTTMRIYKDPQNEIKALNELPGDWRETELLNMQNGMNSALRWDYFAAKVHRDGQLTTIKTILFGENIAYEPGGQILCDFRKALSELTKLPTARLERLFSEHLDLCSYRLDAWQLGMVNDRLDSLRKRNREGVYIGSYGWLEDIRPAAQPQEVNHTEISDKLFKNDESPIFFDPNNAGFIHAPSPNHATAAALLRNGYITHANTHNSELMSVNLTSERVRKALWYIEGIRNRQPLSALLGYQFERGLQENYYQLQLDKYIYPLRKQFPLVADRITEASESMPIEAIEARNVVDGLGLVKYTKELDYPYGIKELPEKNSSEGLAIQAEIDRIKEHHDAFGDLALSESVYQITQGNYDRAGAILDAVSAPNNFPDPEIIRTQRSGPKLTYRICLLLDDTNQNSWGNTENSPRAKMSPRLNNWLGEMIGNPEDIRCIVTYDDPEEENEEKKQKSVEVTVADLHIEPIDFVYIGASDLQGERTDLLSRISYFVRSTEKLNYIGLKITQDSIASLRAEKNPPPDSVIEKLNTLKDKVFIREETFDKALERAIEQKDDLNPYKSLIMKYSMDEEVVLKFNFIVRNDEWKRNIKTFFEVQPLIRSLNELITNSAQLSTKHFLLPSGEQIFENIDVDGLKTSLKDGKRWLTDVKDSLSKIKNDEFNVAALRRKLIEAANFGISDAIPITAIEEYNAAKDSLVSQTESIIKIIDKRLTEFNKLEDESKNELIIEKSVQNLVTAAHGLFGKNIKVLPLFSLNNMDEIDTAVKNNTTLLEGASKLAVEGWLHGITKVRPKSNTYQTSMLLSEMFTNTIKKLIVTQFPLSAEDRWIALPRSKSQNFEGAKLSILMQLPQAFCPSDQLAGLLIDDFTERIPNDKETTGISFHYNQPNSEPPQAILLAVTPKEKGNWEWADLECTLHETLDLAKKRAVEPDMLGDSPYAQFLPALFQASAKHQSTFTVGILGALPIAEKSK